jgi:uncharacterized protein
MRQPDFEKARDYALERLEQELYPHLYYHSLGHTRDEVVPAAERLAGDLGVTGMDFVLLLTGAYFHDIGYIEKREGHELTSARIAAEALPGFGYSPEQIETIRRIILATKMPQSPQTLLEEIMADADLDVLGRDDFLKRSLDLRAELAALGISSSEEAWYRSQLEFLQAHHYFTPAAHRLRDKKKRKNIATLVGLLRQSQGKWNY